MARGSCMVQQDAPVTIEYYSLKCVMRDQSMHHGCFLSIMQSTTLLIFSQCGKLEGERETMKQL